MPFAAIVEMIYHMQLNAALGPNLRFFGVTLDTSSVTTWLVSGVLLVVGLVSMEFMRRRFVIAWGSAQERIEAWQSLLIPTPIGHGLHAAELQDRGAPTSRQNPDAPSRSARASEAPR